MLQYQTLTTIHPHRDFTVELNEIPKVPYTSHKTTQSHRNQSAPSSKKLKNTCIFRQYDKFHTNVHNKYKPYIQGSAIIINWNKIAHRRGFHGPKTFQERVPHHQKNQKMFVRHFLHVQQLIDWGFNSRMVHINDNPNHIHCHWEWIPRLYKENSTTTPNYKKHPVRHHHILFYYSCIFFYW